MGYLQINHLEPIWKIHERTWIWFTYQCALHSKPISWSQIQHIRCTKLHTECMDISGMLLVIKELKNWGNEWKSTTRRSWLSAKRAPRFSLSRRTRISFSNTGSCFSDSIKTCFPGPGCPVGTFPSAPTILPAQVFIWKWRMEEWPGCLAALAGLTCLESNTYST